MCIRDSFVSALPTVWAGANSHLLGAEKKLMGQVSALPSAKLLFSFIHIDRVTELESDSLSSGIHTASRCQSALLQLQLGVLAI